MLPPSPHLPRERLQRFGALSLDLHASLSLILGSGNRLGSVSDLAERIASLLRSGVADFASLAQLPGVGAAKAAAVLAALNLQPLLERERNQATLLQPEHLLPLCADFAWLQQETLAAFFCSSRGGVTNREIISVGTVSSTLMHPREVFKPAIQAAASAVVVVHNHPSGDPAPSSADLRATKQLAEAGRLLGIELLDHLIYAPPRHTSLRTLRPDLFF